MSRNVHFRNVCIEVDSVLVGLTAHGKRRDVADIRGLMLQTFINLVREGTQHQ